MAGSLAQSRGRLCEAPVWKLYRNEVLCSLTNHTDSSAFLTFPLLTLLAVQIALLLHDSMPSVVEVFFPKWGGDIY